MSVIEFEGMNNNLRDFTKLLFTARGINNLSNDYTVVKANSNNIRFNDSAGLTFISEDQQVRDLELSRYSLGQLGTKIGVPARYLEKCVASGRIDLAQDNVNSWLEDYNKDLFIRECDGRVRGILSNRYSVCDSHEILEVVEDSLNLSQYEVKGSFLNEERLHVRLVRKDMLPIDSEDLFAGIFIDSSDVGRSILTVKFGIYKQVCTNGLVISKAGGVLFKQRHIGISADEFHEGLVKSLANVDKLTEYAIDFIEMARSTKNKYNVHNISKEDMDDFIHQIRLQTNLSEESATKVISLMQTKYDNNKWGLINSITEVAQDFTLERRLELEKIAGNMLVA